ncbi:hypothetical protein BKA70DRAFT_1267220 [Coprinopsis sp. MPI-PUGE-AT-0042]|nr:hypothetical protein BKA70DRAFT_1267220 [Coprinopsis sp. MPI-PUGE-AT-0042]
MATQPGQIQAQRNQVGDIRAITYYALAIFYTVVLTLESVLVFGGLAAFLRAPKNRREGRLRFILFSFAILATSSTDITLDLVEFFGDLYTGGPTGNEFLKVISTYNKKRNTLAVAADSAWGATILLGDGLMLWRCFILWRNKIWVLVPSLLAFLGTAASHTLYLIWMADEAPRGKQCKAALMSTISSSVALNIMVTSLILLRLTGTRRRIAKAFPDQRPSLLYSTIPAILVESAAPVAFFGLISVILRGTSTLSVWNDLLQREKLTVTVNIFGLLFSSFSILSPQMIIYRVTTGKSWRNSAESSGGRGSFSQPIQFAHEAVETKVSEITEV